MTLPLCPLTDLPRLLCGCPEHTAWNAEFDFDDLTPAEHAYLAGERTGQQLARKLRKVIARPLPEYTSRPWSEPHDVKVVDSPNLCRVAGCTRPSGDQFVCAPHEDDLDVALGDTPALLEDLAVMAQKQVRFGGSGQSTDSRPLPYNPAATAQTGLLSTAVTTAVRMLCEHRGLAVPSMTVEQASRWLLTNLSAVALDVAGPDIVTEVCRETKRARRLIDRPDERLYIGLCVKCGTAMHALSPVGQYVCTNCGETYDIELMREALSEKVRESLLDLTEMSRLSGLHLGMKLTRRQLEGWVERGRLQRVGWKQDPDRPTQRIATYRAGDVMALIEERKSA